jgi:hypothetical protein
MEFTGEVGEIHALTAPADSPAFSGCTGAQRARIVRLREQIVELSACGVGAKRAAAALGISPQAVRAVRADAWARGELDPMKERLGRQYLATADLLRAEAIERIDEIPAQVLLLASAQAADKGQLLTGGVTARVERVQVPADLASLIDSLPVVVEDGGAYKGRSVPGAAGIEAGAAGVEVGIEVGADSVVDTQSTGLTAQIAPCATACATADASAAPADTHP